MTVRFTGKSDLRYGFEIKDKSEKRKQKRNTGETVWDKDYYVETGCGEN